MNTEGRASDDWQHLKAYGYAPGAYTGRCHECGLMGWWQDKRATTCRPCAEAMHDRAQAIGAEGQDAQRLGAEPVERGPQDAPKAECAPKEEGSETPAAGGT